MDFAGSSNNEPANYYLESISKSKKVPEAVRIRQTIGAHRQTYSAYPPEPPVFNS